MSILGQAYPSANVNSNFTQPNPQAYPPVPQSGLQGNYNIHPMQSAYPAQPKGSSTFTPGSVFPAGKPRTEHSTEL